MTSGHLNYFPPQPADYCSTLWVTTPEVFDASTETWTEVGNAELQLGYYPFMFVHTDGRLFCAGPGTPGYTYFLNLAAPPSQPKWTGAPQSTQDPSGVTGLSGTYGAAVMYEPGKVLKCGGLADGLEDLGQAAVIDLEAPNPQWNFAIPGPMMRPRLNHNAVILADGKVLLVGGNRGEWVGDPTHPSNPPVFSPLTGPPIYEAELFDPASGAWELMASMVKKRTHHSTALLMADGRVVTVSGDTDPNTGEIFSPPYLFDENNNPAPRPQIGFAPSVVHYGDTFNITLAKNSPGPIGKVTLLRLGSNTHGFDMDQRFLLLANPPTVAGDTLTVDAPANANLAPPGNYMLFIISSTTGVPSLAWDVWVGPQNVPW